MIFENLQGLLEKCSVGGKTSIHLAFRPFAEDAPVLLESRKPGASDTPCFETCWQNKTHPLGGRRSPASLFVTLFRTIANNAGLLIGYGPLISFHVMANFINIVHIISCPVRIKPISKASTVHNYTTIIHSTDLTIWWPHHIIKSCNIKKNIYQKNQAKNWQQGRKLTTRIAQCFQNSSCHEKWLVLDTHLPTITLCFYFCCMSMSQWRTMLEQGTPASGVPCILTLWQEKL